MKFINFLINICEEFYTFFWAIGFFGWQIAVVYTTCILYLIDIKYSILFFIGFLLSRLLNKLIKKVYYSPRPKICNKFLASDKCIIGTNGMPSGHAQSTIFSLTIAYLFTHKYLYPSIALFLITITQRIVYNNHTLIQLFIGSIIGIVLGICFYTIIKKQFI
jgi:membrane-associated phospholipid phosphatase